MQRIDIGFDSVTKFISAEILRISYTLSEGQKLDIVRTAYSTKIHLKIKTLNESTVKPLLNITVSFSLIFTKH